MKIWSMVGGELYKLLAAFGGQKLRWLTYVQKKQQQQDDAAAAASSKKKKVTSAQLRAQKGTSLGPLRLQDLR
jgi:hypothetical protein